MDAASAERVINKEDSQDISIVRASVQRFLDREATAEQVQLWDREDRVPPDIIKKLASLGLCTLTVPEEHGGLGRRVSMLLDVIENLAARMPAIAGIYNMNAGYGSLNIVASGSTSQQAQLLPDLVAGRLLFAYGLSEPDIGADLAAVKTTARRAGDRIVINGTKRWCSGADIADYIYALVRSGPPEARRQNLSIVLIPTGVHGITISRTPTMGLHGIATNDVILDNVELSIDDVLGGQAGWNEGWSAIAGPALEVEKLISPAMAIGIARAALDEAWEYSQQRIQGGMRICGHQAVRHTLAEAQTKLHVSRVLMRDTARLVESGEASAIQTSMTKLFVCETAKEIVLSCQQYVMGAYGYAEGFNMQRYVRDILVFPIFAGSSAIQKNNIANLMKLPKS